MIKQGTIYNFSYLDMAGKAVPLVKYRGYVMLIVNTASKCGFTPQFEGLQNLYEQYRDRKFVIIGFPCNQFQGQDPGTNEEIKSFCEKNYGVTFPMAGKINVNGADTDPIFAHLKANARGLLGSKRIKWNFTKFLIDREGNIVKRFAPHAKPSKISSYIEKLI